MTKISELRTQFFNIQPGQTVTIKPDHRLYHKIEGIIDSATRSMRRAYSLFYNQAGEVVVTRQNDPVPIPKATITDRANSVRSQLATMSIGATKTVMGKEANVRVIASNLKSVGLLFRCHRIPGRADAMTVERMLPGAPAAQPATVAPRTEKLAGYQFEDMAPGDVLTIPAEAAGTKSNLMAVIHSRSPYRFQHGTMPDGAHWIKREK